MNNKTYFYLFLLVLFSQVTSYAFTPSNDNNLANKNLHSMFEIPNSCDLQIEITHEECSNEGTPNNPDDDTFTFRLQVNGSSTSGKWMVTGAGVNITKAIGRSVVLGPFKSNSGSTLSFWVKDPYDSNCSKDFTYTPLRICQNDNNGGNESNCESITVAGDAGKITVSNIPSGAKIEYQGAGTGWALLTLCENNCGGSQMTSGLSAGEYTIKAQTFNPYCYKEFKVQVTEEDAGGNDCNLAPGTVERNGCGAANVTITYGNNSISLQSPSNFYSQILNASGNEVASCDLSCPTLRSTNGIPAGKYRVIIRDQSNNVICDEEICVSERITVPQPCADSGGDSDGDGICDNDDNCRYTSNSNQADADGDGIGDVCDDTPNGGGNESNCESITVAGDAGKITVSNIPGGAKIEYQGAGTGWALLTLCENNCGGSQMASGLSAGEYTIKAQTFNPYCYKEFKVQVTEEDAGGNNCNLAPGTVERNGCGAANVTITYGNNSISLQSPSNFYSQILNASGNEVASCDLSCPTLRSTNGIPAGKYRVIIRDQSNNVICDEEICVSERITVPQPCADSGGDSDGDGICDNDDNCRYTSNSNQADADGDGIGDVCDDTPNGGGNESNCESITVAGDAGKITVSNIPSGAKIEYQGAGTGWALLTLCENNCGGSQMASGLSAGEYTIKAQTFNPYCYKEFKVQVTEEDAGGNDCNLAPGTVERNGCGAANVTITYGNNSISLQSPSNFYSQILNASGNEVASCDLSCPTLRSTNGIPAGKYRVIIRDQSNNVICDEEICVSERITVPQPCADSGGDSDGDGICDNDDNCRYTSNSNQADADGDGIGDVCDDTPNGGGNESNCESITVAGDAGGITVSNIPSGAKIEYQGAGTGWALLTLCENNCGDSQMASGLSAGEYTIKAQTFNPYCYKEFKVQVTEGNNTCNNQTFSNQSQLIYWSMDQCQADNSFDEFIPEINSNNCLSVNSTQLGSTYAARSGNHPVQEEYQGLTHTCAGSGVNKSLCYFQDVYGSTYEEVRNAYHYAEFTVTPKSCGKITMFEINYDLFEYGNGTPDRYYLRVLKDGVQIYLDKNVPITESLYQTDVFDFTSLPEFAVSTTSTFRFEFLPYNDNGPQPWNMFEVDYIKVYSACVSSSAGSRNSRLAFSAYESTRKVDLQWATNNTYRNDYYIVEKSTDGKYYEEMVRVTNKLNSELMETFSEIDATPNLGDNYYRLKEVHVDGSFDYSNTQLVTFNIDLENISLFPNPAQEAVYVNLKTLIGKQANITIRSQYGQIVKTLKVDEINTSLLRIDLQNIPNGLYLLNIQPSEGKRMISKKLSVNKLY